MLGTGYFLKIAKINSQQEIPICPNRKICSRETQKIANPQKFRATRLSSPCTHYSNWEKILIKWQLERVICYSNHDALLWFVNNWNQFVKVQKVVELQSNHVCR